MESNARCFRQQFTCTLHILYLIGSNMYEGVECHSISGVDGASVWIRICYFVHKIENGCLTTDKCAEKLLCPRWDAMQCNVCTNDAIDEEKMFANLFAQNFRHFVEPLTVCVSVECVWMCYLRIYFVCILLGARTISQKGQVKNPFGR